MKITIYTIKDCAFSKQEKEYLNTNKLVFEEKDLETNKDFLTEMLAISNNFAGTPVTRVEKDDGVISVLKGFTKEEFDVTFGLVAAPTSNQSPASNQPPVNDTPISTSPPLTGPVSVPSVPTNLPPVETPVTTTPDLSAEASAKADSLKSVMDDLQSKSQPNESSDQPPAVDPLPPNAPSIPDFPAK